MTKIITEAKRVSSSGHVTISSLCPRTDKPDAGTRVTEANIKLATLASDSGCVFVSHQENFLCKNDDINEDLLQIDGLHLSNAGIKRLLKNLHLDSVAVSRPGQNIGAWKSSGRTNVGQSQVNNRLIGSTDRPGPRKRDPNTRLYGNGRYTTPRPRHNNGRQNESPRQDGRSTGDHHTHNDTYHWSKHNKDSDHGSSTKPYCAFCGETNHRNQSCRFGQPIECHKCHSLGHKSKFCHLYY